MSFPNGSNHARYAGDATHTTTFEPEDGHASETVVRTVASVAGVDPTSLSPLYRAVEPDALDAFVEHARRTADPARNRLAFDYEGYDVLVRGDGLIALEERPDGGLAAAATATDD